MKKKSLWFVLFLCAAVCTGCKEKKEETTTTTEIIIYEDIKGEKIESNSESALNEVYELQTDDDSFGFTFNKPNDMFQVIRLDDGNISIRFDFDGSEHILDFRQDIPQPVLDCVLRKPYSFDTTVYEEYVLDNQNTDVPISTSEGDGYIIEATQKKFDEPSIHFYYMVLGLSKTNYLYTEVSDDDLSCLNQMGYPTLSVFLCALFPFE